MARNGRDNVVLFGVTIDYQLRYHDGLAEELVSRGYEVHIVSGPGARLTALGATPGVTAHVLPMARSPRPLADLRALIQWVLVLRRVRPGVIIVGTPKAGLLGGIAGRLASVPRRIYELHGLRLESAQGVKRLLLRLLEQLTCGTATEVISVGKSLSRRAVEARVVSQERISVLGQGSPGGVHVKDFLRARLDAPRKERTRSELGMESQRPVIAFVGRLTEDKGIEVLGGALRILCDRAIIADILIVGAIDDDSGARGLTQLRASGQPIIAVGEVDDVSKYLAITDVLCLPSRREGLPTVILEAFAARVPVVATRATGIVDLVKDNVTGRLVNIDDSPDLADSLVASLTDADATYRFADKAFELVENEFDAERVRHRWADYLDAGRLGAPRPASSEAA